MRKSRRYFAVIGALVLAIVAMAIARQIARSRTFQLFGDIVAEVETKDSAVALTFDDGPVDSVTDSLIAILRARGVHATFFLIGADVSTALAAATKLLEAGHELGNHSFSHQHMVLKSPRTIRSEIERTDSLIRAAGQRGPIYFRPPYGYKLIGLPWFLSRTNRLTVMWSIEPDSYPKVAATANSIVSYVSARVHPGSIIILHPWYRVRRTSREAVGPLIDSLQAHGYRVGTVTDLLATAGINWR